MFVVLCCVVSYCIVLYCIVLCGARVLMYMYIYIIRVEKLSKIGLDFRRRECDWEHNFNSLAIYRQAFGSCDVPYPLKGRRNIEMGGAKGKKPRRARLPASLMPYDSFFGGGEELGYWVCRCSAWSTQSTHSNSQDKPETLTQSTHSNSEDKPETLTQSTHSNSEDKPETLTQSTHSNSESTSSILKPQTLPPRTQISPTPNPHPYHRL